MNKPILLVGLLVLLVFGCVQEAPSEERFKVGVLAPLTGDYSVLGNRIKNGMELARMDILAKESSSPIELIIEDACVAQEAVTATQKLLESDQVNLIGGSFCLVGLVPVIPLAEEKKVITFNTAANPDSVLNRSYQFSTNIAIQFDAQAMANFAFSDLNGKTAAVVHYNTPLGNDYAKHFKSEFERLGGSVSSSHMTELKATDFRAELTKIKSEDPDVVLIIQLSNSLGLFLKQYRELDLRGKIISHSEAEDPNVIKTAGLAAEGVYLSSSHPKEKTEKIIDFERRYEAQFGFKPDILAANAYDALQLQYLAFKECGEDTECMVQYLHSVKDYDGVSGLITIEANGAAKKPFNFKIIQNGEYVPVK